MAAKKTKGKQKQQATSSSKVLKNIEDFETDAIDLSGLKESMEAVAEGIDHKFRTRVVLKVTDATIDNIDVDFGKGKRSKLYELATVQSDAKVFTITIMSSDKKAHIALVKAIDNAGLNLNPSNVGDGVIKAAVPIATKEFRAVLAKLAKTIVDESKTDLRKVRSQAMDKLKKQKKLPQDEKRDIENLVQQLQDVYMGKLDEMLGKKTKELEL